MNDIFAFPSDINNVLDQATPILAEEAVKSLKRKRAQSLVGTSDGRPKDDFYPTPPEATHALLDREEFPGITWEPACGDGAICKVLEERRMSYFGTDLVYRGFGEGDHDFFTSPHRANNIITNPPYCLAEKFVRTSLDRTDGKVAMLCKLAFLEGGKRRQLYETTPLKSVYVFSKRLSMYRDGEKGSYASGMIAFCWLVWQHGYTGEPTLGWV
jgi:hypothetical protein